MAENQVTVDWIRAAQSYKDGMAESRRLASDHRNSDSNRLVWYVAICGYVLVNGIDFLRAVLPIVTPGVIAAILVPWALTAILSVIGHIAIARAAWQEGRYHLGVIASLDVFTLNAASGKANGPELLAIVQDTNPKLAAARTAMDAANILRRNLVQAAQSALLGSFVWALVALLLNRCFFPRT